MVAAPDVDQQVKAAVEFILVVGDVRREVGRVAVGTDEHLVLFAAEFGCLVPDSAVLFVGQAALAQVVDDGHDFAVFMQIALEEPAIVMHAVFFHIRFHLRNVFRQAEADERFAALLLGDVHQAVAVFCGVFLCEVENILAVVTVLRKLRRVLREKLLITDRKRKAEFFELVARVVDVELTPHVVARRVEHGSETVAECAAARVAHVHRAGRVGGDEFDHDLALFAVVAAAVLRVGGQHVLQHVTVKGGAQKEIHEAGAGGLRFSEVCTRKFEIAEDRRGDLRGSHAERARRDHCGVCRKIAVCAVGRTLHGEGRQLHLGKHTGRHGFFHRRPYGGVDLFFCNADCFRHRFLFLSKWFFLHWEGRAFSA